MTARKPCKECPFRRKSMPGHTGDTEPEEFIQTALADYRMPCHLTIDYSDPEWKEKFDQKQIGKECAGNAVFFANICKVPRDRSRLRLKEDEINVFSTATEFVAHHLSKQGIRFRDFLKGLCK